MGYALEYEMQATPAFQWLFKNAAFFGFVLSYPVENDSRPELVNSKSGYIFEPWHWRYIGEKQAQNFKKCPGIVLKQYLQAVSKNPQFSCRQSTKTIISQRRFN